MSPATITSSGSSQTTITVTARDNLNNTVAGAQVTLSVTPTTGNTLTGNNPQLTNASGVATWTLSSTVAEVKTVVAIINGITITQQPTVTVNPATIASLVFTQGPPASVIAGAAIAPTVVVTGKDLLNNTATGFTGPVTMALTVNPTDTLSGPKVVNAVAGVASFPGIRVRKTGTGYTLRASTAAPILNVTSSAFTVTAAPAVRDTFSVQPRDTQVNAPLSSPTGVVVTVAGQHRQHRRHRPPTASRSRCSDDRGRGNAQWARDDDAIAGVAAFTDLSVDKVGMRYTLIADASGLVSDVARVRHHARPGVAAMSTVSAAHDDHGERRGQRFDGHRDGEGVLVGNVIQGATVVLAAAPSQETLIYDR